MQLFLLTCNKINYLSSVAQLEYLTIEILIVLYSCLFDEMCRYRYTHIKFRGEGWLGVKRLFLNVVHVFSYVPLWLKYQYPNYRIIVWIRFK